MKNIWCLENKELKKPAIGNWRKWPSFCFSASCCSNCLERELKDLGGSNWSFKYLKVWYSRIRLSPLRLNESRTVRKKGERESKYGISFFLFCFSFNQGFSLFIWRKIFRSKLRWIMATLKLKYYQLCMTRL